MRHLGREDELRIYWAFVSSRLLKQLNNMEMNYWCLGCYMFNFLLIRHQNLLITLHLTIKQLDTKKLAYDGAKNVVCNHV